MTETKELVSNDRVWPRKFDVVPEALLSFCCGNETFNGYVRLTPMESRHQTQASQKTQESAHTYKGAGPKQCQPMTP